MTNYEKYLNVFTKMFSVSEDDAVDLEYQGIPDWESVGLMELVATIEETFDIMMDTDDIIDFSSFEKGKEILSNNYSIEF